MASSTIQNYGTIQDREFLIPEVNPRKSGFTPRRIEKLTRQQLPRTTLNIECSHLLRTSREDSTHGLPSLEYQLWQEAGKHDPPFPKQSDNNYNSNVWRNFRSNYGFDLSTKGRTTSEAVAAAYPINIPKPSKVGNYTFSRFVKETPGLIKDSRLREIAINRAMMDKNAMELLQIKSSCRYPPIDQDGNILPPEHYKSHPHFFKPIADIPTTEFLVEQMRNAPPTPYGYHENPIPYKPKKSPAWRFNLKSSNKNYQRAATELSKRSNMNTTKREPVSRAKTCTPASTAPSDNHEQ